LMILIIAFALNIVISNYVILGSRLCVLSFVNGITASATHLMPQE